MFKDAYVRLGPARQQVFGPAEVPDALLFIDVERGHSLADMRSVPYEIYSNVRHIVVRLDGGEIETNSDLLQAPRCYVGTIDQRVGHPAQIASIRNKDTLSKEVERDLLRRARAIELTALLHWGKAIWEPTDHHYLLPSGRHSATFIKLANAIRGTRDAIVLARWMVHHFDHDDTGLVIDSVEASTTVVGELLWRADPEQRRILIPEILLAYAQGKVPQMEAESAISYAKTFINDSPDDVRAAMKLALRLAGEKRTL